MKVGALHIVLLVASVLALVNADCAPPEALYPCTCYEKKLRCSGINEEQLRIVLAVQKRYPGDNKLEGLTLNDYQANYIPSGLLAGLDIKSFRLNTSTLLSFNDPNTKNSSFSGFEDKLTLLSFTYHKRLIYDFDWNSLATLRNLERLELEGSFAAIQTQFPSLQKLAALIIHSTSLESITDNAFSGLSGLSHIYIDCYRLQAVNRNMFPRLAEKLKIFQFNGDAINVLPENLFDGMTALEDALFLLPVHNIPPLESKVPTTLFMGSSLTCDCRLKWILPMIAEGKVDIREATCRRPLQLAWRRVQSLTKEEIC